MKKMFVVFAAAGLMACSTESKSDFKIESKEAPSSSSISAGKVDKNAAKAAQEKYGNTSATTTIEFDHYNHDFGKVFKGSVNTYVFRFKNIGSVPCNIKDAKASCGCTIPKKPEKPVLPGEYGELEVVFKPKDSQVGTLVNKTVTVTANTVPNPIKLEIKAFVVEGIGK